MFMKLTTIALGAALAAGTAYAEDMPMVGGAPMYPSKTIVQNASQASNLTTLVAAVKAAGLVDTLSGPGPFTVFAPTNAAFDKLPDGTVNMLLKPENKDKLVHVLTCHVVKGKVTSAMLTTMIRDDNGRHEIQTVGGCTLTATQEAAHIYLTDEQGNKIMVTQPDVEQSNGVVHVIDGVLLPKM